MSDQIIDIVDVAIPGPTGDVTPEAIAARDAAQTYRDEARTARDAAEDWRDQAEAFAGSNVAFQDSAMSAVFDDENSDSRQVLNSLYSNINPGTVSVSMGPGITQSTRDYNAQLCLFNEASSDMHLIRRAFREAMAGERLLRVSAMGMSKMEGYGTQSYGFGMFGGSPTMRLMQLIGGKTGLYCVNDYDGRTTFSANMEMSASLSHKWAGYSTGPFTITHTSIEPFSTFEVYYLMNSAASSNQLTVKIDGVTLPAVTMQPFADGRMRRARFADANGVEIANTTHVIEISGESGVIIPMIGYDYDREAGIEINNFARSSSNAGHWLNDSIVTLWNAATASVVGSSGLINIPEPDMFMIQTGLNNSTNSDISELLDKLAALGKPVLIIGPGGYTSSTAVNSRAQRQTMYDAAARNGNPLVDFMDRIGFSQDAQSRFLMNDSVHENYRGYLSEAALLARVVTAI